MTDSTTRSPRTEAGRRMLAGIQDTSDRLDVALNALDYILAIEAEAAAPCINCRNRGVVCYPAEAAAPDAGLRERIVALMNKTIAESSWSVSLDDIRAALAAHCSSGPSPAPPTVKRTPSGFRFIEDGADPADLDTVKRTINDEYRKRHAAPEFRDLMPDEEWREAFGLAAGSAVDVDRLAEVLEEMQAPMAAGMAYLALPIPEHDWNPSDPTERLHDARAVSARIVARLTHPDPTGEPE